MTSRPAPAHPGRNAFLFVIVTVTLNMLSFGIIMPIMPELLSELTDLPVEAAAPWNGWLSMTYAAATFLAMPVLGGLSDRYGRRPVLLLAVAALGVDMLVMGLAPSIGILFVGRTLAGLFAGTTSVANAYIADVTEPEQRGRAFGLTGAAFGLGFVLGPVVGGLLGDIDTRLPFFAAAGIAGLNFLYGVFVLPESLRAEDRRPFKLSEANPFGALKHFVRIPEVGWFILTIGCYQIAHAVYPSTWSYFGASRYDWSPLMIGVSLGVVGLVSALSQALLTGWIIQRFGAMRAAAFGIMMQVCAMIGFAFAFTPAMAFGIIFVSGLGAVVMPAINTITSTLTPRNRQGELQGAQASIMAFTLIFSPVLMTQTFSAFAVETAPVHFAGAAFLLAAILTALSLIPFAFGVRQNRRILTSAASGSDQPESVGIGQNPR